ncbi:globin domain-containing protein [Actinomadura sp. DC4]|uniref:globin domain-containing protein n=1 Tax=Actinomadura sp. DC4 TaxID=3055069 RepID=UPI0025B241CD|nr:globin domain-containing protein [Actinomadura sp. DC4]MDN3355859.1 globin domain-containing protein [Actinomadura sp. DC4]
MKSLNPRVIKESFALFEPRSEEISGYFYGRLFAENPRLRTFFPPAMDRQRERLFHALRKIVWSLDSPDTLSAFLSRLGRDHRKFGVGREHYDAMGRALLATLRKFAGDAWTAEMESAWRVAYTTAATMMIDAAEESAASQPPWWTGEVVGHELHAPDLAALTVRPDRPLPYTAGQYITIQVARWPWTWRPYSVANAPREDGLLRFHVRAVPAGWVSGTLVRHVKVGDTLLLGHAAGTMTLDPDADRAILCVAGGTGLAPLKALVEEAIARDPDREIHLLFGARTPSELYDLADLRALEDRAPGLRVVPVVASSSDFDGEHGLLPEVLGRFQDWSEHDVYVAGPPEMVESTVTVLHDLGVLAARIHYDRLDDR